MCKEGSAIGFVVEDIALTFVKRIISEQFALVTGKVMVSGISYLSLRKCLRPDTCFENTSRVAHTKGERRIGIMLIERSCYLVSHLLGACVETHFSFLVVIGYDNTCEVLHR